MFRQIVTLELVLRLRVGDLVYRGKMTIALQRPAVYFWDGAVSGLAYLTPVLRLISSVPVSLLSPRTVGLQYSAVPP